MAVSDDEIRQQVEAMFAENRDRLLRMIEVRLVSELRRVVEPDDILQDAFLEAYRQLKEGISAPKSEPIIWLRLIMHQQLIAVHRRFIKTQKRNIGNEQLFGQFSTTRVDVFSMSGILVGKLTSPSMAARKNELIRCLRACLEKLTEEDREIISLRNFEQLTGAEAARELGLEPAATTARYVRALRRFREHLVNDSLDKLIEDC